MADVLLSAEGVSAGYGRGDIIHDIDMEVRRGSIAVVIGPNGAGKSTMIKTVAGLLRLSKGEIRLGETDIGGLAASEVARRGVAYVPQEANVFRQLTVAENLEMGCWTEPDSFEERVDKIYDLFPVLKERMRVRAGSLSGGQRQMVAFGMAMMVEPKVLLLDEPSAGLSPTMVEQMFEIVQQVNESGIAVLMVEQNAMRALKISHHGYVMAAGTVAMSAPAAELLDSSEVSELYLGTRT